MRKVMRKKKSSEKRTARATPNRAMRSASRRVIAKRRRTGASAKIHQGVGLKSGEPSEAGALKNVAVQIGAALGGIDRKAHEIALAGSKGLQTLSEKLKP
jgi:hypothetical protein